MVKLQETERTTAAITAYVAEIDRIWRTGNAPARFFRLRVTER